MLTGVAYLISLPISVWLLATICAVIDEPRYVRALLQVVASLCLILIALLITDRALLAPLLAAFASVLALHLIGFWWLRRARVGLPIYERKPAEAPVLPIEDLYEEKA